MTAADHHHRTATIGRPRTYDHDAIAAEYNGGEKIAAIAAAHGCNEGLPSWIARVRGLQMRGQGRKRVIQIPRFLRRREAAE